MSRVRPAWYYERQARIANDREAYRRNNPPTPQTAVRSRGPATDVWYRSLALVDGTEHRVFKTAVDNDTLQIVTAVQAGLLTAAPADGASFSLRGSGLTPTKLIWQRGVATPSRVRTPWNSSYIKYYEGNNRDAIRSHYSMPFSRATGAFSAADLRAAFNTIMSGGARTTMLGAENGRASLVLERAPISAMS